MADTLNERVVNALGAAYEVKAEIGRGGMGVVYRAQDRKLHRDVAIKVLPPDLAFRDEVRVRFLREAETAAQLNHPNIVPIYSVDDHDGLVWFVMGLVEGESLAARLAYDPRPPLDDVRRILRDVADALAYAHAHGIIHRDIKPDNILLERQSGRPVVTDFGIARALEADSRLTLTGIAVGTPAYMSPEQATGEREVDGRSDLYSLAVVGYQMLAGELPFQATNTPAMLMKHINEPLPPLRERYRDIPPGLAAAIERALAKKPNDRWRDAGEFRDAIASNETDSASPRSVLVGVKGPSLEVGVRLSAAWKRPAASPREDDAARMAKDVRREVRELVRDATLGGVRRALGHARDAIEASNAGGHGDPLTPLPAGMTPLPPVPPWMPASWRDARRQWRQQRKSYRKELRARRDGGDLLAKLVEPSREDRIRRFRRRLASSVMTVSVLAGVNFFFGPPHFAWFLIPAAFMGLGVLRRGSSLWADGIRFRDVFGKDARERLQRDTSREGRALPSGPTPQQQAERLAPADVLEGPYGTIVHRAATDRAAALQALEKLSPADRALIPDVAPSVNALADRVGSIATSLHRLDEDVTPEALSRLERRIADTKAQPESPDRDKRVALLERQQATLADLLGRRETLRTQLESASLLLQNMRLDLLALNSAGVQSVINDVSSATQEARALSREIQNALAAAKEVR
jgi:serine/threonine protein kinase